MLPEIASRSFSIKIAPFLFISKLGKQAHSLIGLVTSRAFADNNHAVIISVQSLASSNNKLDAYSGNAAFKKFRLQVDEISAPMGSRISFGKIWKQMLVIWNAVACCRTP